MDNNHLSTSKLAGLRTLAGDQKNKDAKKQVVKKPILKNNIPTPPVNKEKGHEKDKKTGLSLPTPPQAKKPIKENLIETGTDFSELQKIVSDEIKSQVVQEDIVVEEKPKPKPVPVQVLAAAKTSRPEREVHIAGEDSEAATVITDTKKDRFNLFSETFASFSNWIKEKKKQREAKKAPKYTVPEASRRKGVIQKATSKSGITTNTDHDQIQNRIKERQQQNSIEESEPKIISTKNTEPVFPPPPSKKEAKIIEEPKEVATDKIPKGFLSDQSEIVIEDLSSINETDKVDLSPKIEEVKETPIKPRPEKVIEPEPNQSREEELTEQKPEETVVEENHEYKDPTGPKWSTDEDLTSRTTEKEIVNREQQKTASEIKTIPAPKKVDVTSAITNQGPVIPPSKKENSKKSILFTTDTNLISFIISAIILILFLAIGLGYAWYKNKENNTYVSEINKYTGIVSDDVAFVYDPFIDKNTFINKIIAEYQNPEIELTQFAFATTPDAQNVVEPETVLKFLDVKLGDGFGQSISQLYFGGLNDNNPYLALKITDQTVALAGMLNWEKEMKNNLSEIFKLKVNQNKDTEINSTSTRMTSEKFIDGSLAGVEVRVLKSGTGEEEIIYGFVKPNILIITTSSQSFSRLTNMIK
ncbi:MAG: hypothetical protein R3B60_01260 [Candidatus Paceibacterota bacterium]